MVSLLGGCLFVIAISSCAIAIRGFRHKQNEKFEGVPNGNSASAALQEDDFDEAHGYQDPKKEEIREELTDLFLDYVMPAVLAHEELQKALVEGLVDGQKVQAVAKAGVRTATPDAEMVFYALNNIETPMASSPPDPLRIETLTRNISIIESHYKQFTDFFDELAEEHQQMYFNDTRLSQMWREWVEKHNSLVDEFEKFKRYPRYGDLYRPIRESRWGGHIHIPPTLDEILS